jgi:hypothetical protein
MSPFSAQGSGHTDSTRQTPSPPPPLNYTKDLGSARHVRAEFNSLYSGGANEFQVNSWGFIRLTVAQYSFFGDQGICIYRTPSDQAIQVELLHYAGLVSLGLHLGNGLVKEVAARLLPLLQALPVADKDTGSMTRYHSERLVA